MSTAVQFRGGTNTEHKSFTGADREITVDTTKKVVVVHDGQKEGGYPQLRADFLGAEALTKADPLSPCLEKTAAQEMHVKAGTSVMVGGEVVHFESAIPVQMPSLVAGEDYA